MLLSAVIAALVTILGLGLFFALPRTNTYAAAPGVVVAFIANGGVHGSTLEPMFNFKFWIIAVVINFLLYFMVSWVGVRIVYRMIVRREMNDRLRQSV